MTYSEKLKDQRWQKKRLCLLEAAGWKCQGKCCPHGEENPQLQIHHKVYLRNTDPWDYGDWAYSVLCVRCHRFGQSSMEKVHSLLAKNEDLMTWLEFLSDYSDENQALSIKKVVGLLKSIDHEIVGSGTT